MKWKILTPKLSQTVDTACRYITCESNFSSTHVAVTSHKLESIEDTKRGHKHTTTVHHPKCPGEHRGLQAARSNTTPGGVISAPGGGDYGACHSAGRGATLL